VEIPPSINSMLNYFNSINDTVKHIAIVTDNIRPRLLFDEDSKKAKTTDDDVVQIIESYTKELNKVVSGTISIESSKYLQMMESLTNYIDELLKRNEAHIRLPADFSENSHTYHTIPLSAVKMCLKAFSQKHDDQTEAYHGLALAKVILNSADHAYDFIVMLYPLYLNR
jgi:hypothetical protein